MSNLKLRYKLSRLKGMKITRFLFYNRDKELHLALKPYKNGCRCPECERRARIVRRATELRRREDLTLMGMKILLWYAPKEINARRTGGRKRGSHGRRPLRASPTDWSGASMPCAKS